VSLKKGVREEFDKGGISQDSREKSGLDRQGWGRQMDSKE
jgi:hypothetical protein